VLHTNRISALTANLSGAKHGTAEQSTVPRLCRQLCHHGYLNCPTPCNTVRHTRVCRCLEMKAENCYARVEPCRKPSRRVLNREIVVVRQHVERGDRQPRCLQNLDCAPLLIARIVIADATRNASAVCRCEACRNIVSAVLRPTVTTSATPRPR
jgi:hypothetical protein